MAAHRLILVLGDQLSPQLASLRDARAGRDTVVMAEVAGEARYVPHNRHKIALIFAAMRHFADELRTAGFEVHYYHFEDGLPSLRAAVDRSLARLDVEQVVVCQPGEWRLFAEFDGWDLEVPLTRLEDDRFLASREGFSQWAEGRKQLRMEYFYREMRKRYGILLTASGEPEGGKWNYDAENREGWRGKVQLPRRTAAKTDAITRDVLELVERAFPDNPGDLDRFYLATTRAGAEEALDWFLEHCLPLFGRFQDALAEESPWLFHSLISMYLNIGLLEPLEVCHRVEQHYRDGRCELASAEGFIRQILGWREYVRGIYWLLMPEYAGRNQWQAERPLPGWFWTGDTELRCLQAAISQSLELGYAHHIQRLMVTGNFALLAGLAVEQVCEWYLAVYVDAFEWVELPNTLGMALNGDGGTMASKPYAASGRYIQRQGDHCKQCVYRPDRSTGEGACPFNSLYWHFIDRHGAALSKNPRMGLALRNWERKEPAERAAIVEWGERELERLAPM
jgi:deoxyribodipyrimidine photolyase-related protein